MPTAKPELQRGEVFGCWTVLRPSSADDYRRPRYLCRSTCCGKERIMRDDYLRKRAAPRCVHCKGNGQKAVAP